MANIGFAADLSHAKADLPAMAQAARAAGFHYAVMPVGAEITVSEEGLAGLVTVAERVAWPLAADALDTALAALRASGVPDLVLHAADSETTVEALRQAVERFAIDGIRVSLEAASPQDLALREACAHHLLALPDVAGLDAAGVDVPELARRLADGVPLALVSGPWGAGPNPDAAHVDAWRALADAFEEAGTEWYLWRPAGGPEQWRDEFRYAYAFLAEFA